MQLNDFNYNLPETLIARYPSPERTHSQLMVLDAKGGVHHAKFHELSTYLNPGDLVVFNDTRVIYARLYGKKSTGGKVEIMIERVLNDYEVLAQVKVSKALTIGAEILLDHGARFKVLSHKGSFWYLKLYASQSITTVLTEQGHVPLPPYFKREDEALDKERYQTVYAKYDGSVAAPTAGLHFDLALLEKIKAAGIELEYITLHVGAGTYQPIRGDISSHQMHSEYCHVSQSVCDKIAKTKARGGRVIAVGTTTLRTLESAARSGRIKPFQGETDIFLKPGSDFHCVDALITNFHLPKSSLLLLVSAFSTVKNICRAYEIAVEKQYRFYSYGDAMLISRVSSTEQVHYG